MKIAIQYNKKTGEILSCLSMSCKNDFLLNIKNEDYIEINRHHQLARGGIQNHWIVSNGKLKKKAKAIITKESKERDDVEKQRMMPEYLKDDTEIINEILIDSINELNMQTGLSPIDTNSIKAQLIERREQYKNPNKK